MQAASSMRQAAMPPVGKPARKDLVCVEHGGYSGFVSVIGGKEISSICPSCEQVSIKTEMSELRSLHAKTKQQVWVDRFGHAGIPPKFLRAGFSNYVADTADKQRAKAAAEQYAVEISGRIADGHGLIFLGPSGTGKTHLSCAIAKHAIKCGFTAVMTSVHELMQVVKASYRKDSDMSELDVIKMFSEPDLLVLDEVGVQHESNHEFVTLTTLINKRYAFMKPTIFLTNLQLDKLSKVLGTRIIDRLQEMNDLVACDWESYRGRV